MLQFSSTAVSATVRKGTAQPELKVVAPLRIDACADVSGAPAANPGELVKASFPVVVEEAALGPGAEVLTPPCVALAAATAPAQHR